MTIKSIMIATAGRGAVIAAVAGALAASAPGALADPPPLRAPAVVLKRLDAMKRVDRLEDLPREIAAGDFDPLPRVPSEWAIANPGHPWNATDVVSDSTLPFRRLVFGACADKVCVLSYEHGGIAHYYQLRAFVRHRGRWKAEWLASCGEPVRDLPALRAVISNESPIHCTDAFFDAVP